MPRKLSIPETSDLLRDGAEAKDVSAEPEQSTARHDAETRPRRRSSTGRVRHDEKITVYVSADELVGLEQARLSLRADHAIAVDRGRIVREAVAEVLDDLHAQGASSRLVRRLRES